MLISTSNYYKDFITPELFAELSNNKANKLAKLLHSAQPSVEPSVEPSEDIKIYNLPYDIIESIVEKYKSMQPSKYVLRDWVPKDKLVWKSLSGNPCAIEMLMKQAEYENSLSKEEYDALDEENKIGREILSTNRESIEILKKYPSNIIWTYLSENKDQRAVDMIKKRVEYEKSLKLMDDFDYGDDNRVDVSFLCNNENPQIMELVKEKINYEKGLSMEEYENLDICDTVEWMFLSSNPSAIELLKENPEKIDWEELSYNTNPYAIDLLRKRAIEENNMNADVYKNLTNKINWHMLSKNPSAVDLLVENIKDIDWMALSANPNAIDLLKANKKNIDWSMLSSNPNPNAIEILRENTGLIDWYMLSQNPNAIELLKANPKKIYWGVLSGNEKAFDLLKDRYEYESNLTPEEYDSIVSYKKIDWGIMSKNKGLFVPV